MAKRPFKKLKRAVVYFLIRIFLFYFNIIPRTLAMYSGEWIALILWHLSGRDRHKAFRHLSLVFGDRYSPREKKIITRSFFINSGKNVVDFLRMKTHFLKEIKPIVTIEGLHHIDDAYKKGKGVLGISGHIGNFEMMGAVLAAEGYKIAVIGRELYEKRLDRILVEGRQSVGLTNISTTDSPKKVISWLRKGNILGVLIDTDSHRVRGEFIPAFGRWSYTPIGQTILSLKTGAAIIPIACFRNEDNSYHLVIKPEVKYSLTDNFDQDVYDVTSQCTKAIEELIKSHVDQYIWQHNRWRTRRPAGA